VSLAEKQPRFRTRASAAKHESFLRYAHFRWLKIAAGLLLLALSAFYVLQRGPDFRLRHLGGSWYGYATGIIGAALIVWLALLGVRKRAITDGHWSLKAWVSAHVYLGLSLIVIVTLHTGFQFGWNVHTLAYGLMMLVILSGIFGVAAYVRLPLKLSENRGETTEEQMLEMIRSLDGRLAQAAQPLDEDLARSVRASLEKTRIGGNLWQRLTASQPRCPTRMAYARLAAIRQASGDPALASILPLLEQKETVLKKARRHIQLRSWLEAWLYIHVPATLALIAALTAHIVSVFFYW
jgi:hypothetical protein